MAPKICPFCGNENVSEEHVWSQHLHDMLPQDGETSTWRLDLDHTTDEVHESGIVVRPGSIKNVRFKVPCEVCNNGWMSMLEERVKHILAKLVRGEPFSLDLRAQNLLYDWIVLKAIIVERHYKLTVTSEDECRAFRNSQNAPRRYLIGIGRTFEPWHYPLIHHGIWSAREPGGHDRTSPIDTHVLTIGIGTMFIHAVLSNKVPLRNVVSMLPLCASKLETLAMGDPILEWPTARRISRFQACQIATWPQLDPNYAGTRLKLKLDLNMH